MAVPQPQGRGLLPLVGESVNIEELGSVVAVRDQEREGAARVHGLQLRVVADEEDLRAGVDGDLCDAHQRERACQGGFVDDHELPAGERGAVELVVGPPLGGVLRGDPEIIREHLGRDS